jgi:tetratricopeptide (TPR) repeat protein
VNELLVGILTALAVSNAPAALRDALDQSAGIKIEIPDKNNPVEREYQKLLEADDAAQEEVDAMIAKSASERVKGDEISAITLRARLRERLAPVRKGYEDFLVKHPGHARARLAFGSFLNDLGEEVAAAEQWEKARELDPKNPAAWNNLANFYGHAGPVTNAFVCYAKAIELDPRESVYYQNFATTVYLFRRDATNFFGISEEEVFDKAMALYRKALAIDPGNFHLATDLAQSYYGMKPKKTGTPEGDRAAERSFYDEAIASWRGAQKLARDDTEREGIQLHYARLQISAGQFDEARASLGAVTNALYLGTKKNLEKKIARLTGQEPATNAVPILAPTTAPAR